MTDPTYACVLVPPKLKHLRTKTYTIYGRYIGIPSNSLFVTDDGSIYVVTQVRKDVYNYTSLKSLIETAKKARTIVNISTE